MFDQDCWVGMLELELGFALVSSVGEGARAWVDMCLLQPAVCSMLPQTHALTQTHIYYPCPRSL